MVKAFATRHTIPSLGFLVWERRKKLKPEYHDLTGEQIRDLRLSGVEVSAEIRMPKVAYLGDTSPQGLDAFPEIYQAQILILEMTFVAPSERAVGHPQVRPHPPGRSARAGRAVRERGDHRLALQHAAAPDQILRIIEKRLPESLQGPAEDLAVGQAFSLSPRYRRDGTRSVPATTVEQIVPSSRSGFQPDVLPPQCILICLLCMIGAFLLAGRPASPVPRMSFSRLGRFHPACGAAARFAQAHRPLCKRVGFRLFPQLTLDLGQMIE